MLLCIINCKSILRGCWHRWSGETGKITVLSLYTKLKGIFAIVAVAKSLQSCLTLCDPIDGSPRLPHPWDSPGKNTGVGCHFLLQCMKVKSESELLSRVWLCDPMDCSLPGSSVHGIFQAKVLEWGAIAFSILFTNYVTYSDYWTSLTFFFGKIRIPCKVFMSNRRYHLNQCLLLLLSCFSRVWLCATLWTAALQAPLSMAFSRQEY